MYDLGQYINCPIILYAAITTQALVNIYLTYRILLILPIADIILISWNMERNYEYI